jgi:N utilization substance protein B
MQARTVARELVLLSLSQISSAQKLEQLSIEDLVLKAVRILTEEAHESLKKAVAELQQSRDKLLASQTTARTLETAREQLELSQNLAQNAINQVGAAIEFPEFLRLAEQQQVRHYALTLLRLYVNHAREVDQLLTESLEGWNLERLGHVERDLLRLAVTELQYVSEVPDKVAIDEAIELAKKYGSEQAPGFINGVLRRVMNRRTLPQ